MVESAGLVIIYDNKILLGHPTGSKWYGSYSFPKGHIEEGENKLEAAIRETREEVGLEFDIKTLKTKEEGCINYLDENKVLYKKAYYFVVELNEPVKLDPTKFDKEEIDYAEFLTKEEAEKRIFWRFKSILEYIK